MTEAAHAVLELGDVAPEPDTSAGGGGEEQVTVYIEEVIEGGEPGAPTAATAADVEAYATDGQEISMQELQQVCTCREISHFERRACGTIETFSKYHTNCSV